MEEKFLHVMLEMRGVLADVDIRVKNDGDFKAIVGSTLIPASIDVGIASARLICSDRSNMWIPAHALFRVQMEYFSRGAFFIGGATQLQAERFLGKDVLPKRRDGNGKKKPIWPRKMIEECSGIYGWGSKFIEMFDGLGDGLNSLVHGGKMVSNIYWSAEKVGFGRVSEDEACDILVNPLCIAAQGLIVLLGYEGFSIEGETGKVTQVLESAQVLLGGFSD